MLKIGSVILSVWATLGLVPALYFVIDIAVFGGNAPAFSTISSEEFAALSPNALRAVNSIAVFANGSYVAFSSLVLFAIWNGLNRRKIWVFWALVFTTLLAWITGAIGNYMADTLFPEADILSALFLIAGFYCSAKGLFDSDSNPD